jgi:hypothetical protein
MTLVPEIRDQLHATAQRRVKSAGPAGGPARRWRGLIGSLAIPASVLVVASVLAVVLLDVHHLTHGARQTAGQPASAPPPGWGKLTLAANDRVHQQDAACRPQRLPGASALRHDAPGQDLSSVLGVLHRPAPASQRVSERALRRLPVGRINEVGRGIYLRYVRHGRRNGITYYFVPAANVSQFRAVPDRCYREQLKTFRQLAARYPADQRAALIGYEAVWLQQARTLAKHPAGVCLATVGAGGSGTGPCVTAVSLRKFDGRLGVSSYGNDHVTVTVLIVPDRVATVTVHYKRQSYPGRVPRALTVTERAVQNLVIFSLQGAYDPPSSLVYRSASGSVLWSVSRP